MNCTEQKNMRNTTPVRHTIRFRRWSRKAYAAFASIGHCVTIGCLPKSVADSSLSKQKATGTAGHAGCEEDSAWKGVTESRETDIGIPIGCSMALISGATGLEMNLQKLLGMQVIRPCVYTGEQEEYILKTEKLYGTDYRDLWGKIFKPQDSANPCLFHIHEFNQRKI